MRISVHAGTATLRRLSDRSRRRESHHRSATPGRGKIPAGRAVRSASDCAVPRPIGLRDCATGPAGRRGAGGPPGCYVRPCRSGIRAIPAAIRRASSRVSLHGSRSRAHRRPRRRPAAFPSRPPRASPLGCRQPATGRESGEVTCPAASAEAIGPTRTKQELARRETRRAPKIASCTNYIMTVRCLLAETRAGRCGRW